MVLEFFRSRESQRPVEPYEEISGMDEHKLRELELCIYQIREQAKKEGRVKDRKGRLKTFDNYALSLFLEELAIILDDIRTYKHIKDYIAGNKAKFTIEVDLEEF